MDHDVWKRLRRIDRTLVTIVAKLDAALAAQKIEQTEMTKMTKELSDLIAQVKATTDLEASAVVAFQGLADQIAALKDDPAAIADLAVQLKTSATALGAAIPANTPAAPAPVA